MSPVSQIQRSVFVNDSIGRLNNVQEINADFNVPVSVETKISEWQVSSITGKKKCFERIEKNRSCLTMLVQLPAGRSFKKFGHNWGVEFFVLSGFFSDSDRDYNAGCYMRNLAGTYHDVFTRDGCIVLLKLGWFQPLDRKRIVIESKNSEARWLTVSEPGISRLVLHHFSEESVDLYRIRSECWLTFRHKKHGLELFVCEGTITVKGKCYEVGDWLRYPAGSRVKVSAIGDVCLYAKKYIFPLTKISTVCKRI
ncbi:hypothetical protein MNBD_GAMMA05-155 [hydrothermal vent metagenome]|uniref:ChrR-like cupin domain-containing protein n=1 Tax=hydrothermal vent metagenome TaxID=652676 RepID=A0A3B0WT15_9ZZZZ